MFRFFYTVSGTLRRFLQVLLYGLRLLLVVIGIVSINVGIQILGMISLSQVSVPCLMLVICNLGAF